MKLLERRAVAGELRRRGPQLVERRQQRHQHRVARVQRRQTRLPIRLKLEHSERVRGKRLVDHLGHLLCLGLLGLPLGLLLRCRPSRHPLGPQCEVREARLQTLEPHRQA